MASGSEEKKGYGADVPLPVLWSCGRPRFKDGGRFVKGSLVLLHSAFSPLSVARPQEAPQRAPCRSRCAVQPVLLQEHFPLRHAPRRRGRRSIGCWAPTDYMAFSSAGRWRQFPVSFAMRIAIGSLDPISNVDLSLFPLL